MWCAFGMISPCQGSPQGYLEGRRGKRNILPSQKGRTTLQANLFFQLTFFSSLFYFFSNQLALRKKKSCEMKTKYRTIYKTAPAQSQITHGPQIGMYFLIHIKRCFQMVLWFGCTFRISILAMRMKALFSGNFFLLKFGQLFHSNTMGWEEGIVYKHLTHYLVINFLIHF